MLVDQGGVSETAVVQETFAFEGEQTKAPTTPSVTLGIEIPGYKQIVVAKDSVKQSVTLLNPERNNVYFRISMILTETGEEIYKSNLIQPGQTLYEIELSKTVSAGEYPLTIKYETFTTDGEFTPQNGASMESILIAS